MPRLNNQKGFLAIIELVIALGIICFLAYFLLHNYFKPVVFDSTDEAGQTGQVSVSSPGYKAFVDSAKEQVQGAVKKDIERSNQIEDLTSH